MKKKNFFSKKIRERFLLYFSIFTVPLIPESFDDRVGIAFDFMRVSMAELPLLSKMVPILKTVFWEYYDDMLERTERRRFRKKIESDARLQNLLEVVKEKEKQEKISG